MKKNDDLGEGIFELIGILATLGLVKLFSCKSQKPKTSNDAPCAVPLWASIVGLVLCCHSMYCLICLDKNAPAMTQFLSFLRSAIDIALAIFIIFKAQSHTIKKIEKEDRAKQTLEKCGYKLIKLGDKYYIKDSSENIIAGKDERLTLDEVENFVTKKYN